jgi:glycosyltransferase involved in cell wall biosynthesis
MVEPEQLGRAPLVSIITPVYNVARFVAETIDSVLRQTCGDFELLIVDDGSTDDTVAVAGRYVARDPRIRLFRQANGGIAAARNRALAHARGRYIALLDGDDVWFPTYLADQLALLERFPEIAILGANALNLGGVCNDDPLLPLGHGEPIRHLGLLALVRAEDSMSILAVLRREVGDRIGWFDPALRRSEDYDLWLRAAAAGFGVAVNTTPLGRYRRRPNSLSSDELTMLRAIRQPLLKLRASRPNDAEVLAAIDAQLSRNANRELVVEARTALVECDRHRLAARLSVLAQRTGDLRYRVAYWLSAVVPAVLLWLYRVKSRLHDAHRWWRRRNARSLVP